MRTWIFIQKTGINIQYFLRMSLSVANDWFLGSKPMVCRYVTTSYMGANYLCIYMHFWVMQICRL